MNTCVTLLSLSLLSIGSEKLCRKVSVYFFTALILLISVSIVYTAQYIQRQTPQQKSCSTTTSTLTAAELNAGSEQLRGCYCNALLGTNLLAEALVDCTSWVQKARLGQALAYISAVRSAAAGWGWG